MLRDIPNSTSCFIDANIIYYSLVTTPDLTADCVDFFWRIAYGELTASTSSAVIAEAIHKVMLADAVQQHALSRQGLAHRLQRQRHLVSTLSDHKKVIDLFQRINIHVEPITLDLLEKAVDCSIQYQLLTNDALTVAVMEKLRLTDIVTNDEDFGAVAHLKIWKPG